MVFAAWCDRQYGFVYDQVRAHKGLAWFPLLSAGGEITWEANPAYRGSRLVCRGARRYAELGVRDVPIYQQFVESPESVQWVSDPARFQNLWGTFEP